MKKAWRDAHPEAVKAYTARANKKYYAKHGNAASNRWRAANIEKTRKSNALKEARRRAQKRGSPGLVTRAEWDAIKAKQKGRCFYCSKKAPLHMDHVIPLARGGCHMAHNIVGACKSCNSSKCARILTNEVSLFDALDSRAA